MVRQRDKAGTYGGLSTIVQNGKTRLVKNKSRKSLSADGSESGRNPCRARETQRENHFRVRVKSQTQGAAAFQPPSSFADLRDKHKSKPQMFPCCHRIFLPIGLAFSL